MTHCLSSCLSQKSEPYSTFPHIRCISVTDWFYLQRINHCSVSFIKGLCFVLFHMHSKDADSDWHIVGSEYLWNEWILNRTTSLYSRDQYHGLSHQHLSPIFLRWPPNWSAAATLDPTDCPYHGLIFAMLKLTGELKKKLGGGRF